MILRFKAEGNGDCIAFNSTLQIYTTDPAEVKRGQVLTISPFAFKHITQEIHFNGYSYTEDLTTPAEVEEIPGF